VPFLDARGGIARDNQIHLGNIFARPAIPPEERDRFQVSRFSFFERAPNVGRFATRRNRDQNITRFSEGHDLSGKNFLESEIVSGSGDEAAALCQVHGRIRPAIFHKPAGKLSAKISRIRRTPAIAAGE
jgi:hypothetical protein